jgi:hypothetical protein
VENDRHLWFTHDRLVVVRSEEVEVGRKRRARAASERRWGESMAGRLSRPLCGCLLSGQTMQIRKIAPDLFSITVSVEAMERKKLISIVIAEEKVGGGGGRRHGRAFALTLTQPQASLPFSSGAL